MDKEKLKEEQNELVKQLIIPRDGNNILLQDTDLIFTFDIQYEGEVGYVAVDVQQYDGTLIDTYVGKYEAQIPYQPGYFAFREAPLLLEALGDVMKKKQLRPTLLVIDGHGTAHPRKMGVASFMGIKSGIPSIGIAKDTLIKFDYKANLDISENSIITVQFNLEVLGYVLRTQENVKPVFVSAGHLISQGQALEIVKMIKGEYRIPEPIRRADQKARAAARGETELSLN